MDTGQTIDFNFGAVVASLGFKEKVEVPQVMARITELVNVENKAQRGQPDHCTP